MKPTIRECVEGLLAGATLALVTWLFLLLAFAIA